MNILSGRIALVTGASRGLGRAIARALGDAGADVVVTDLLMEGESADLEELTRYSPLAGYFAGRDHIQTRSTAEEISSRGTRGMAMKMDVTRLDEIEEVVREVESRWGTIDILVNNAGVMDNMATLQNQEPDRFDRDLRVNLSGAFYCIKAVWPAMKEKGWGRIVNISSITGMTGAFAQPGYGASKAGLIGLTRTLAIEGAQKGITVNAILPGLIETEAVKLHQPEMIEHMKMHTAMKRLGKPEEVASVVVFIASDMASYITGAAIPVTGGMELLTF